MRTFASAVRFLRRTAGRAFDPPRPHHQASVNGKPSAVPQRERFLPVLLRALSAWGT
jgi:hypothetical protein